MLLNLLIEETQKGESTMDKLLIILGNIWLVGSIVSNDILQSGVMMVFGGVITICGLFAKGEKDE